MYVMKFAPQMVSEARRNVLIKPPRLKRTIAVEGDIVLEAAIQPVDLLIQVVDL